MKNFLSRKASLQKKTFQITDLFGANAFLLIELDSKFFSFRSKKDRWPPSFEEVVLSQRHSSQILLLTEEGKKS